MTAAGAERTDARQVFTPGVSDAVFWNIRDIQLNCRVGRTKAWELARDPGFPAPLRIGSRRLVWPRAEVLAFMEQLRRPSHYGRSVTARASAGNVAFTVRRARPRVSDE